MGATVGVRELKDALSETLRRVRAGEVITVTDRGRPVVRLVPVPENPGDAGIWEAVARGEVTWNGNSPNGLGLRDRVVIHGPSVSSAVIEDRR